MDKISKQYDQLINKIEEEKREERERAISSLMTLIIDPEKKTSAEDDKQSRSDNEHDKIMFSLLCLKLKYAIQIAISRQHVIDSSLKEDVDGLIVFAKQLAYKYEITNEFLCDIRDVLSLIISEEGLFVLSPVLSRLLIEYTFPSTISNDLYYLATQTADTFEHLGYIDESVFLLERFCNLSKKRNDIERHQELVSNVLRQIGEKSPEAVIRIAQANENVFRTRQDDYAGDFYWSYGCALQKADMSENAVIALEKCYYIRAALSGESDWFTAVAKREYSFISFVNSKGKHGREGLREFVDRIEEGVFSNIDSATQMIIEGKTLYALLMDQSNITDLEVYDYYLTIYEKICDQYDSSNEVLLKRRLAQNLRGGFFFKAGDYIRAERSFIQAIESSIPDNMSQIITVPQIQTNLLMIYYVQNDLDMALPLLSDLLDSLNTESTESGLTDKDRYRIYTMLVGIESQSLMEIDPEELEDFRSLSKEICDFIIEEPSDFPDYSREMAVFLICAIPMIINNAAVDMSEQHLYLGALERISGENQLFQLDSTQLTILYYVTALLSWNIKGSCTDNMFTCAINHAEKAILPLSTRIALSQTYASYTALAGNHSISTRYLNKALKNIENHWKSCVRYLNDERLLQILAPTQLQFAGCYAVLRQIQDVDSIYENVLRFKGLASLAGRERNRLLHSSQFDLSFLKSIRSAQNKVTSLETESVFRDNSKQYYHEKEKLRELEAVFAQKFPGNNSFVSISLEDVKKAIPDNSVVIEYFYCVFEFGKTQFEDNWNDLKDGFDVFIIQKKNGDCKLSRLTIDNGLEVLDDSYEFVEILQAESKEPESIDQIYKMDLLRKGSLRATLFKKLILPVIPYLRGYEQVYIAPDYGLANLPFDIIYDENQKGLGDEYSIIKIECARDFLYKIHNDNPTDESLIIGNPIYELKNREMGECKSNDGALNRFNNMDPEKIKPLPFSQIEVEHVGQYLQSRYYTGLHASKQLLLRNQNYKTIHIATHGYYDLLDSSSNGMISSCLLFSGVCNWLMDGRISSIYGNGIVTADEISRLDLRGTELVVLSSCLSGMSDVSISKNFMGMIGAFSAAGVHYVITHLWDADDFGTAVFLDAFYYHYINMKESPPRALAKAKHYMQNVSVGELKNNHWFKSVKKLPLDQKYMEIVSKYESMDDQTTPFKEEAFWAGFTCYQCY